MKVRNAKKEDFKSYLEIKKERSGNYAEAILYDGQLKKSDQIALSNLEGKPLISGIKPLLLSNSSSYPTSK